MWKVPARNPNFKGRAADLQRIADALLVGSWVTVHSIRGMGGVGKSQLATEYAHLNAGLYELVWWVEAEESATIPDQFTNLAGELGVEPAGDPESLQRQVHDALRRVAGWLLIFDNADQVEPVQPWMPAVPMPPGTPGHVLVTTRRGGFNALGDVFDVDVLDLDAAVQLMVARAPSLASGQAAKIAKALGNLPLALEQAAAYLDRTQMPADDYLTLLNTRSAAMLAKGQIASRKDTIASLWTLSFERLEATSPSASQLLDICAYLAPEAIPLDLFTKHSERLPAPLSDTAADGLAFIEAIAELVDYSLAKRTATGLQIHRLVQAALRARHDSSVIPKSAGLGEV